MSGWPLRFFLFGDRGDGTSERANDRSSLAAADRRAAWGSGHVVADDRRVSATIERNPYLALLFTVRSRP